MFAFGTGTLIGTLQGVTNPTPINFGLIQSCDLDITTTLKSLYGQYNFPVAIGGGTKKVSGKAKMAKISGMALGMLAFGVVPSTGQTITQYGESHPYATTVTLTPPNSGVYASDLGVIYYSTGLPMTRVTTPSAVGQYGVNTSTGVYTFYSGDSGNGPFLISYTYTVSASGETFTINQSLLGTTVNFSANLSAIDPTTSKQFSVNLVNCVAEKLSFGTKVEDFTIPELDFQCYANAAGQVMTFNFGDAA